MPKMYVQMPDRNSAGGVVLRDADGTGRQEDGATATDVILSLAAAIRDGAALGDGIAHAMAELSGVVPVAEDPVREAFADGLSIDPDEESE